MQLSIADDGPDRDHRLRQLEEEVDEAIARWLGAGVALREIQNEELFKPRHGSFLVHVAERLGLLRHDALNPVKAAAVAENLGLLGADVNYPQLLALFPLPAEDQRELAPEAVGATPPAVQRIVKNRLVRNPRHASRRKKGAKGKDVT